MASCAWYIMATVQSGTLIFGQYVLRAYFAATAHAAHNSYKSQWEFHLYSLDYFSRAPRTVSTRSFFAFAALFGTSIFRYQLNILPVIPT